VTADDWIAALALTRHPEGGWFRETYRAAEGMAAEHLPARYGGPRAFSTAILFLLAGHHVSRLHRLKSDEVWHFHAGAPLMLVQLHPSGACEEVRLGPGVTRGERVQAIVPAGSWLGAWVPDASCSLVGCTVAPGFDFADFELADRDRLLMDYPQHRALIERLT
jgi:predicted cupin superfamily sugar epimerase